MANLQRIREELDAGHPVTGAYSADDSAAAEAKELSNQVTRLNVELIAQQRTVEKVGNSIDALRLEINREPDSLRKQIEQLSDQIDELQKGLRNE